MITAAYKEIPLKDVKRVLNARGRQLAIRELIRFTARLETFIEGFSKHEIDAALWYTVKQLDQHLDGTSFDSALKQVLWPSKVAINRPGRKSIPVNKAVQAYQKRSKEDRADGVRNEVHVRLKELIGQFLLDQDALMEDFNATISPFKRRRIRKSMITLDKFLDRVAKPTLHKEFSQHTDIVDQWIEHYKRKDVRAAKQKWDRKTFKRWVTSTIEELEATAENEWQHKALQVLMDHYPSRRDDDAKAYRRAVSLWREFDGHSIPELSNLGVELRNSFGIG